MNAWVRAFVALGLALFLGMCTKATNAEMMMLMYLVLTGELKE